MVLSQPEQSSVEESRGGRKRKEAEARVSNWLFGSEAWLGKVSGIAAHLDMSMDGLVTTLERACSSAAQPLGRKELEEIVAEAIHQINGAISRKREDVSVGLLEAEAASQPPEPQGEDEGVDSSQVEEVDKRRILTDLFESQDWRMKFEELVRGEKMEPAGSRVWNEKRERSRQQQVELERKQVKMEMIRKITGLLETSEREPNELDRKIKEEIERKKQEEADQKWMDRQLHRIEELERKHQEGERKRKDDMERKHQEAERMRKDEIERRKRGNWAAAATIQQLALKKVEFENQKWEELGRIRKEAISRKQEELKQTEDRKKAELVKKEEEDLNKKRNEEIKMTTQVKVENEAIEVWPQRKDGAVKERIEEKARERERRRAESERKVAGAFPMSSKMQALLAKYLEVPSDSEEED